MSRPPTVVYLRPGTILTDDQRLELVAKAMQTHFHEQFSKLRPDDADILAKAFAKEFLERSNTCGEKHLQSELIGRIELVAPSADECEQFEELMGEIIEFRYKTRLDRNSKAYRILKRASGIMWKNLREALGLPGVPPETYTGNAADIRG